MTKLLKQNDGAGGLIFRQNTAGKAMKQNFNFGRNYKADNQNQRFLTIPSLINQDVNGWTFCFYVKKPDTLNRNYFYLQSSTGKTIDLYESLTKQGTLSHSYHRNNILDPSVGVFTTGGKFFVVMQINEPCIVSNIRFGGGGVRAVFTNSTNINVARIFNRNITSTEREYMFNNQLGNEVLNSNGLVSEIPITESKIVGSDIVLSDQIGDNNLKINNLPAGTLEEQRNYANANLFELW